MVRDAVTTPATTARPDEAENKRGGIQSRRFICIRTGSTSTYVTISAVETAPRRAKRQAVSARRTVDQLRAAAALRRSGQRAA